MVYIFRIDLLYVIASGFDATYMHICIYYESMHTTFIKLAG